MSGNTARRRPAPRNEDDRAGPRWIPKDFESDFASGPGGASLSSKPFCGSTVWMTVVLLSGHI